MNELPVIAQTELEAQYKILHGKGYTSQEIAINLARFAEARTRLAEGARVPQETQLDRIEAMLGAALEAFAQQTQTIRELVDQTLEEARQKMGKEEGR